MYTKHITGVDKPWICVCWIFRGEKKKHC